jgi:DNA-binding winged helix-turn-helix (wHTH) protein
MEIIDGPDSASHSAFRTAPLIRLGELIVRPNERSIEGPAATRSLEPLVMTLFVALLGRAGKIVERRQLFSRLWGASAVGDDNLNRLVALLRRALTGVGASSLRIETVPGTGYILRLNAPPSPGAAQEEANHALAEGINSWRTAAPEPDYLTIALLSRVLGVAGDEARILGLLALLHRHAAEYGLGHEAAEHLRSCEAAARRALELNPHQPEAGTAIVSINPLYGRWYEASERLVELCAASGRHPVPENDLAVLEMATGQVEASKRRRDRLIRLDPLAAGYCYKSVYQHWALGDRIGMDHVADRAMQLWPHHPAVWMARFWTLAYTSRLPAAQGLLARRPPAMPLPIINFLSLVLGAAADGHASACAAARDAAVQLAGRGPAQAIASLFALGLLGRPDEAFLVAERYYLQQGPEPVPLHSAPDDPRLNEQHRRLTQILFTPACAAMRESARFESLCRSIGLVRFWEKSGITPDHLR